MGKALKATKKAKAEYVDISAIDQYVINRIKEIRTLKGLSQRDIAYMMDVSQNFIAQVENPTKREKYNLNHIYRLAQIFKCAITDILPEVPKE